ncbi:MAG: reverse gyrase [Candidatus Njordarchaeales archaeon]
MSSGRKVEIVGKDPAINEIINETLDVIREKKVVCIFERLCPNCGWKVPSFRLESDLACLVCIPENIAKKYYSTETENPQLKLGSLLEERKALRKFRRAYRIEKELQDYIDFFKKLVGAPPWSAQRVWARRILTGESFAIIAPTGVGKTVFGLVTALYLAHKKGLRTYIILPTKTLLRQVLDKIRLWEEKLNTRYVIAYHSEMSAKEKKEFTERFQSGDFKILITTSQFLIRNLQDIIQAFSRAGENRYSGRFVDFMFVDDVDSFLRNVKNLDRAMVLLGYTFSRKMRAIIEKIKRYGTGSDEQSSQLTEDEWSEILRTRERAGILVVSSATGRVRGVLIRRLFSIIFGFSIGSSKEGIRNVLDTYDDQILKEGVVTRDKLIKRAVELIEKLGSGGLVFVARGADSDEIISELVKELSGKGIRALGVTAEEGSEVAEAIEKFAKREVDILVGKASPYGLLVRGLDLPEIVRYAIFIKVPHFSVKLEPRPNPVYLSFVMRKMVSAFEDKSRILEDIRNLASQLVWLSATEIRSLEDEISNLMEKKRINEIISEYESKNFDELSPKDKAIYYTVKLYKILIDFLREGNVERKLAEAEVPFEVHEEGGSRVISLLTADIKTYIQASGRTSRLFAGGITKGLSIILPSNRHLLNELDRKLSWTVETTLSPLSDINLEEVMKEIDNDRERVRIARLGKMPAKEHLQTCLFIVESPTKARTIASFFGRPTRRVFPGLVAYEIIIGKYLATIVATIGHVTDLITHRFIPEFTAVRKNGRIEPVIKAYTIRELAWPYGITVLNIDSDMRFIPIFGPKVTCGQCGYVFVPYLTVNDKLDENIQKRKCEKIKRYMHNLSLEEQLWRMYIDKKRTELPLKCPRCGETENLYDKTITIEALRRLALESEVVLLGTDPDIEGEKIAWDVAILLKPYAKKIMRVEFHEVTRSAIERALAEPRDINFELVMGQLLRRIEDRWIGFYLSEELKEILNERNLSAGRVQSPVLSWIVQRYNLWKEKEKWTIISLGKDAEVRIKGEVKIRSIEIKDVKTEERKLIPPPPLITDTMLTYASILYGMSADRTMRLAQTLFEVGLVTYIRTDSTRVSDVGLGVAKRLISENFGAEEFVPRRWSRGEEGAHECIRPTRPLMLDDLREALERGEIVLQEELPADAYQLYDMIVRIFMASQMREGMGLFATVKVKIEYEDEKGELKSVEEEVSGLVEIKEKGFLKALTPRMAKLFTPRRIPYFKEGVRLSLDEVKIEIKEIPKAWPLREGEIVRLMRERGIGRPSTYATIIEKLFERRYVKRIQGGFVVPRERGIIVNKIVYAIHPEMVSEERTRIIFDLIDKVASGKEDFLELLKEIYSEILKAKEEAKQKVLPPEIIAEIEKYRRNVERRMNQYQ